MSENLTENDTIRIGYNMQNGDEVVIEVSGWTDPLNALAALKQAGSQEGILAIVQKWMQEEASE